MATSVSTSNRITGMYSGIDTDALVKAMSMGQQSKIDVLNQKKQQAEWKKDVLTDFNNKLRVFRETYGSVLGDSSLITKGTYASQSVTVADNSGVKVIATPDAKTGVYNLRVDQIATASVMKGSKLSSRTTGLTDAEVSSTAVSKLSAMSRGAYAGSEISFSINGVDFSFSSDTTLKKIMETVNKSDAGVTMSYSQISDSVSITSNALGSFKGLAAPGEAPVAPPPYSGTRPDAAAYEGDDAGYQAALADYQAKYDEYDNTVMAQYRSDFEQWKADSEAYKADLKKNISITDLNGFLAHLGLNEVTKGQDAVVYINGETEARTLDTNSLTLDGMQMSFLKPTGPAGADFTIESDSSETVGKIKKFVEDFNALIKELYTAYNQKANRDYKPLTDEQREAMSDKEIEVWEQKAKEGLLYRDNNLGKLIDDLRSVITKSFGDYGNLASIGITAGKYTIGETIQLEVDETKLASALESDPTNVYNMMSTTSGSGGLIVQFNKLMDSYIGNAKSKDIQNLTTNITDYTKKIKEQESKLATLSEKYYRQYASLETALSKMQSQQDAMASIFGSGSAS